MSYLQGRLGLCRSLGRPKKVKLKHQKLILSKDVISYGMVHFTELEMVYYCYNFQQIIVYMVNDGYFQCF